MFVLQNHGDDIFYFIFLFPIELSVRLLSCVWMWFQVSFRALLSLHDCILPFGNFDILLIQSFIFSLLFLSPTVHQLHNVKHCLRLTCQYLVTQDLHLLHANDPWRWNWHFKQNAIWPQIDLSSFFIAPDSGVLQLSSTEIGNCE